MRRIVVLVSLLCTIPGLATAQRGGGRGGSGRTTDRFGNGQSAQMPTISRETLTSLDPLAVLLDKQGAVGLTDDQVAKLKSMNAQLMQEQQPAFHMLDSLDLALANLGSPPAPEDAGRARTLNMLIHLVAGGTRQRYDSAETQARTLLTDAQKKKADDALKEDHDQLNRLTGPGRRGG